MVEKCFVDMVVGVMEDFFILSIFNGVVVVEVLVMLSSEWIIWEERMVSADFFFREFDWWESEREGSLKGYAILRGVLLILRGGIE